MASTLMKLLLMIMFAILLQCNDSIVEGGRDMELESELRILNKTPIKTIRTEIGDVFDCIDIDKQPSLDHPLLKNHVIKTRPISSHSINTMINEDHHEAVSSSSFVKPSSKIGILRKLDCPYGTVPIRRTFKEDLIRAKLFSKSSQQLVSSINDLGNHRGGDDIRVPDKGQYLSIAKTDNDSGIDYIGIEARINLYNPPVVGDGQVSTAQLWIEGGPKEELNSLQAGWIVAPSLFGDYRTRLFGKWQRGDEGCYDILCPGFIQVDKDHPIGDIINGMSQFAGLQYDIKISISQDYESKHWWLGVEDLKIGYWPVELAFTHLILGTPVVAWGGLAQASVTTSIVPNTGNGNYPYPLEDFTRQCYMRQMKVIPTKTLNWEDPNSEIINPYSTDFICADVLYYGQMNHRHKGFGHTIGFGGPGGYCHVRSS